MRASKRMRWISCIFGMRNAWRRKFIPPEDRTQIDHIYDSAARAKVLVETLQEYENTGEFQCKEDLGKGETYFIIHPILKHIAILSKIDHHHKQDLTPSYQV